MKISVSLVSKQKVCL